MTGDQLKRAAAEAALEYVRPGAPLGVGTGSTVAFFIDALGALPAGRRPSVCLASSTATAARLRERGLAVAGPEALSAGAGDVAGAGGAAGPAPFVYVDGADEVDPELRLIKGRGGAAVREKVLATAARLFVCIVDESKLVARLGTAPVPVEVVRFAGPSALVRLAAMGGRPHERPGFVSDDGDPVLDVTGLDLRDPEALELELDAIPGAVGNGLFARRRADVVVAAGPGGIRRLGR